MEVARSTKDVRAHFEKGSDPIVCTHESKADHVAANMQEGLDYFQELDGEIESEKEIEGTQQETEKPKRKRKPKG